MADCKTYSQIFEPPEGLHGQLCILSALSADESFVDNALEVFTGKKAEGRRQNRCFSMLMMLDKAHPLLDRNLPGLYQLEPISESAWEGLAIQHAKVAVMQFGSSQMRGDFTTDESTIWRLVVCTGNWTTESAKSQIEMVWTIDVPILNAEKQNARDLMAAINFLGSLKALYVCPDIVWFRAKKMFEAIYNCFEEWKVDWGSIKIRFISTLKEKTENRTSLLPQIAKRFNKYCDGFNRIVVGSGFFEQSKGDYNKPKVIKEIESKILGKGFTDTVEKYLIANPKHAGQVSVWDDKKRDWHVYAPCDPCEVQRELHAKFVFAGKAFKGCIKKNCMYVGSGNLSVQGMLEIKNIEAGVVFDSTEVLPKGEDDIYKCLAFTRDSEESPNESLKAGDGPQEDEPSVTFVPPSPIMALNSVADDSFNILWNPQFDSQMGASVVSTIQLSINGRHISVDAGNTESFKWNSWGFDPNNLPQWVNILVNGKNKFQVPLLCDGGMLVEAKLYIDDVDDLLDYLACFPKSIDYPDGGNDGEGGESHGDRPMSAVIKFQRESLPYANAMKLIEGIAEMNNRNFPAEERENASKGFLLDWIFELEMVIKNLPPQIVESFKSLNLDFVSILKSEYGFAPNVNGNLKKIWDAFVNRWVANWHLDKAEKI